MSKYVKRVIPFESSDIPAIQKWLEDMAQQGLFYKGCGMFCAEFEKGEPLQTRYRLDFCDVVACDIPDEKKEMYEKNGWQVVGEFKSDLIVLCTDDPDPSQTTLTQWQIFSFAMLDLSKRNLWDCTY